MGITHGIISFWDIILGKSQVRLAHCPFRKVHLVSTVMRQKQAYIQIEKVDTGEPKFRGRKDMSSFLSIFRIPFISKKFRVRRGRFQFDLHVHGTVRTVFLSESIIVVAFIMRNEV